MIEDFFMEVKKKEKLILTSIIQSLECWLGSWALLNQERGSFPGAEKVTYNCHLPQSYC